MALYRHVRDNSHSLEKEKSGKTPRKTFSYVFFLGGEGGREKKMERKRENFVFSSNENMLFCILTLTL